MDQFPSELFPFDFKVFKQFAWQVLIITQNAKNQNDEIIEIKFYN